MQRHECNKHNYLCINDSLNFLFPCENQGVTKVWKVSSKKALHMYLLPFFNSLVIDFTILKPFE
jgi:hypothetical protein